MKKLTLNLCGKKYRFNSLMVWKLIINGKIIYLIYGIIIKDNKKNKFKIVNKVVIKMVKNL
jgi:hypothetical protein